jgi:nucleotide-binding universal stress UspA family protein
VDSVSQAILEEVRRRSARLLVMGACGHSTVREFLLGSVAKSVLKESPVPVFLCH